MANPQLPFDLDLRSCPVCGNYNPQLIYTQRFQAIAGMSLLEGYDVVACGDCGCVYADRIPPKTAFENYYRALSKYEHSHRGGREHDEETARLANLASWIASEIPSAATILDVGCGTGRLLQSLREQGFTDVTGLDPSEPCCENARQLTGSRIIHSSLCDRPQSERAFDAVVLSAVLEHLPDVAECMRQAATWLVPGGMLLVEVPHAGEFALVGNAPYQEFSVEHINFFSAASLANLMAAHGFTVTSTNSANCPVGPGVFGRVLRMCARFSGQARTPSVEGESVQGISAYVEKCRTEDAAIDDILRVEKQKARVVHVWGVGTLCQRLAAESRLAGLRIGSFIDSNAHSHGKEFAGAVIRPPSELPDDGSPVLIATWQFAREIRGMIRRLSSQDRDVIDLFPQEA